jgi:hypothetical protein
MPYDGQRASKYGHSDLIKNKDIQNFLSECSYIEPLSEEGAQIIKSYFQKAPSVDSQVSSIIASDGSRYTDPIRKRFPSTQVGYVKFSLVLVDIDDLENTQDFDGFVDPFKIAKLHNSAESLGFALPGSNVVYKECKSVSHSFRKVLFEHYTDPKNAFDADGQYTIGSTLRLLDSLEDEPLLVLRRCPECKQAFDKGLTFESNNVLHCPHCNIELFYTDALRIHEDISDFGDATSAITRFMNATEHLLIATLVRYFLDNSPQLLGNLGFFIDGPLAVFGPPARIHSRLMAFYDLVRKKSLKEPLIIGLQKSGSLYDHTQAISPWLDSDTFTLVTDHYRRKHIQGSDQNNKPFGQETYYGQDFIYKSPSGSAFVFGLVYPFGKKDHAFYEKKEKIENYPLLSHAIALLKKVEFDLYPDATIPIALAHRHASISIIPGGKALDFMTKNFLNKKHSK